MLPPSELLPTPAPVKPTPSDADDSGADAPGADGRRPVIRVGQLGKMFKIYPRPSGRIVEWLSGGRATRHEEFWALRDVSLTVARGEAVGVIGVNGSGKSTLLKILSGAMYPTRGTYQVDGRVLSLLELGTGVNPELSGRENVVNSARLLAFPPGYVGAKMAEIESFAGLGDFFDRPTRLYSSGMLVRLVFSMFACFDPDVFIVDEALSVGDLRFQQKCARRIREMLDAGVTMLFVSHDLAAVESLCDRVMVLHSGQVRHLGDKAAGIRMYYALSGAAESGGAAASAPGAADARRVDDLVPAADPAGGAGAATTGPGDWPASGWHAPDDREDLGDGRVRVTGIQYRRPDGAQTPVVEQNQWLDVYARFEAAAEVGPVNVGVSLHDRLNRLVFARGWINADVPPVHLRPGQQVLARFRLKLDLEPGEYSLGVAAAEPLRDPASPNGWNQQVGGARYAELPHASKVAVVPRRDGRRLSYGTASLPCEFTFTLAGGGGEGAGAGAAPVAGEAAGASDRGADR